jgi:GAF domain-containing protein
LSGDESRVLAEEQAALRRVATLVARGVLPEEVFAAVTAEVGRVLSAGYAHLGRYDADGMLTSVAAWGAGVAGFPVGSRWSLGGEELGGDAAAPVGSTTSGRSCASPTRSGAGSAAAPGAGRPA